MFQCFKTVNVFKYFKNASKFLKSCLNISHFQFFQVFKPSPLRQAGRSAKHCSPAGHSVFLLAQAVAAFVPILKSVDAHAVHVASALVEPAVKYSPDGHAVSGHGSAGAERSHNDPSGRHTGGALHGSKAEAPENMLLMSVTDETSQPLMSSFQLNLFWNAPDMLVTAETFQSPMRPYVASAEAWLENHKLTAVLKLVSLRGVDP